MKILVVGGTHGNELLGVELVRALQDEPIAGVDVVMANTPAVERGVRYVESDLNRSFGDQPGDTWEQRRAKELTRLFASYDVVLDFHNTQTPGNNCCFVGVNSYRDLYSMAAGLGFEQCIQATYDCMNKYAPNVLSIEISVGDPWDSVAYWREQLARAASGVSSQDALPNVYRYARRVTWDEREKLSNDEWVPFRAIAESQARQLQVAAGAVPIFVGSRLTEFYATLLEPVDQKRLTLQITDKDDRITTL